MSIVLLILSAVVLAAAARTYRHGARVPALGLLGLALLIASPAFITTVPTGRVGIPVLFGKVRGDFLSEGIHLVNPLVAVPALSVRTETYTMSAVIQEGAVKADDSIRALSRDGLEMPLDVTVAYRLIPEDAPWVYRNLGSQYVDSIIRPAARTAVREGLAQFSAHEAYGAKRRELADRMQQFLQQRIAALTAQYKDFAGRGFEIHPVMLRNVGLPASLRGAIELKLAAEQEALKMPFILERELKEAERKKIEAGGIADFQKIVSEGINESFLRWKGIEATQALAKSENAKIVVIGAGKNGLPVILNPD